MMALRLVGGGSIWAPPPVHIPWWRRLLRLLRRR